jgi:hypothetical protein
MKIINGINNKKNPMTTTKAPPSGDQGMDFEPNLCVIQTEKQVAIARSSEAGGIFWVLDDFVCTSRDRKKKSKHKAAS